MPFIVRYKVPAIGERLSSHAETVHDIARSYEKWRGLARDRAKVLAASGATQGAPLHAEILTTDSKARLDEIYAPHRPPSKGSLAERAVAAFEASHGVTAVVASIYRRGDFRAYHKGRRRDDGGEDFDTAVVTLLAGELNKEPSLFEGLVDEITRFGAFAAKEVKVTSKTYENNPKKAEAEKHRSALSTYFDYSAPVRFLRDHQVLALRRGSELKLFATSFSVDDDRAKNNLKNRLFYGHRQSNAPPLVDWRRPQQNTPESDLIDRSVADVYSRLMKRRATSKIWRDLLKDAEAAGIKSFGKNYHDMMLFPPLSKPRRVLGVDPGFRGGIKLCALSKNGAVKKLESVDWMRNEGRAVAAIGTLLTSLQKKDEPVLVALGTGTASSEAEHLVELAAARVSVAVDIAPVNEDGASVWSASPAAKAEFPDPPSVAVLGAVSIARRLQDPMNVLVSIPPKSLGLGMYQHDLDEPELLSVLDDVSVECIAAVGVDVNTCSVDLLRHVPGLKKKGLAENIIAARPHSSRAALKAVKGVTSSIYENCIGFCKVFGGEEALDETTLHPTTDYVVARALKNSKQADAEIMEKFNTTSAEISRIRKSMEFGSKDVRLLLRGEGHRSHDNIISNGSIRSDTDKWTVLKQQHFPTVKAIKERAPIRGIQGKIKNVAAFGAFVDIGLKNNGLLHISKYQGDASRIFAGARVGVDVLEVDVARERITLGLAVRGRVDNLAGLEEDGIVEAAKEKEEKIAMASATGENMRKSEEKKEKKVKKRKRERSAREDVNGDHKDEKKQKKKKRIKKEQNPS